jgi:ERF superfamily
MNVPADDMLLNELAGALAKAQGAMNNASMNRINPHFKSKYADLAALWDAVRKPLSDNGLSVVQIIRDGSLHTMLLHTSGQRLCSDYPLPATARPQEMGSALTYARRYSLSALVGIAADEDDDATAITRSADVETPPRVTDAAPLVGSRGAAVSVEDMAREAAKRGAEAARVFWDNRTKKEQEQINKIRPELNKLVDAAEARLALEMDDDDNGEHLNLVEAFKHGQQAKADGHQYRAIPPEYRQDDSAREALCWQAGWKGEPMPEFNTGDNNGN